MLHLPPEACHSLPCDWHLWEGLPAPPPHQAQQSVLLWCYLVADIPPQLEWGESTIWGTETHLPACQIFTHACDISFGFYSQGHWCCSPFSRMQMQWPGHVHQLVGALCNHHGSCLPEHPTHLYMCAAALQQHMSEVHHGLLLIPQKIHDGVVFYYAGHWHNVNSMSNTSEALPMKLVMICFTPKTATSSNWPWRQTLTGLCLPSFPTSSLSSWSYT